LAAFQEIIKTTVNTKSKTPALSRPRMVHPVSRQGTNGIIEGYAVRQILCNETTIIDFAPT